MDKSTIILDFEERLVLSLALNQLIRVNESYVSGLLIKDSFVSKETKEQTKLAKNLLVKLKG